MSHFRLMTKLLLLLLVVPGAGIAAGETSGNKLLEQCSYAEALLNGTKIHAELGEDYAFLCLGYVSGIYDALFQNDEVCGPSVANWQQTKVVYNYLKDNSDTLHFERYVLTKVALKNAFPCN